MQLYRTLLFASWAFVGFAQLAPTGASTQQSTANQLPLSGRSGNAGTANSTQLPTPGATTSVNTVNTTVQSSGDVSGSVRSTTALPFSGKLGFREAIDRGLRFNLSSVGLSQSVRQAKGQARVVRSVLLPNVSSSLSETVQQNNLQALGLRFSSPIPGFSIPSIVGPFNYFDLRARLSQNLADYTAVNNYRSAKATTEASENNLRDARDLIALAVGGAYLQVAAAKARVESARVQIRTAEAQDKQASEQRAAGIIAQTDRNRTEVQLLTSRQRLSTLENDLAKQKINLARLTGLPATEAYDITDDIPFAAADLPTVDNAVGQAIRGRADLQAAESQIKAANYTYSAAKAERLPTLSVAADYGAIGINPSQSHGTFSVTGTLRVPIWQGGRIAGDIEQADAALSQRRAEAEDLKGRIEADIRNAFLDLQTAAAQVEVSRRNQEVSRQTLDLTRQRFEAGIDENVVVVQAQEAVSNADLDYINSVFTHNVAKLSLARALGGAPEKLSQFLSVK